ncbi:hypothetical protein EQ486_11570 [Staphylococcus pseudintermedius]|nr:hypothetical protein [Staphylococcus pseudintermedius]
MNSKAKVKSNLKQYFSSKKYLYKDGEKVAHIHVVNSVYYLHGHANFVEWKEEEITKDTRLDLIVRFIGRINNDSLYTINHMSINEHLSRFAETLTTHFYVENEDRELILIWKDGELV